MKELLRRLDSRSSDSGLSLIEVIVAMMIFAMIATGIAYTMVASLNLTKNSTARQQAANLASQEIDLARSIDNLFALGDATKTQIVNGVTYTIKRQARWVSDPSVDQRCGIGGGILRYKRVNVTVGWTGMTSDTPTVRADTLIDPGVRINDPELGTVLISVTDSSGEGVPGVTVTVTPASPADGATSLAEQPAPTDALGCTYALMVDPGSYNVTVSKADYVDITQNSNPTTIVSVKKSSASAAVVTLDRGGHFPISYPAGATIPNSFDVSFLSTYGTSVKVGGPSEVVMFPFPAGYVVLPGVYNDPEKPSNFCKAVDPAEWLAGTTNGVDYLDGVRPDPVATVPGGTAATAHVPMGVVTVKMPSSKRYLIAVSESTGPSGTANPGCQNSMTYSFGYRGKNESVPIALPFGSWKLYASSSASTLKNLLSISYISPPPNVQLTPSKDIITFDPRGVAP